MGDKLRFVVAPTSAITPNIPAVIKKVVAMEVIVYAAKMMLRVTPFSAE